MFYGHYSSSSTADDNARDAESCDCGHRECDDCGASMLEAALRRSGYFLATWEVELVVNLASETHLRWMYDPRRTTHEVAFMSRHCGYPSRIEWEDAQQARDDAEQARDMAEIDAAAARTTSSPLTRLLAESVRRKFTEKAVGVGRRLTPTTPARAGVVR